MKKKRVSERKNYKRHLIEFEMTGRLIEEFNMPPDGKVMSISTSDDGRRGYMQYRSKYTNLETAPLERGTFWIGTHEDSVNEEQFEKVGEGRIFLNVYGKSGEVKKTRETFGEFFI